MRVWLDDLRPASQGRSHPPTQAQAFALLQAGGANAIRLDLDVSEPEAEVGSGYGVPPWIDEHAALRDVPPLRCKVYSANPIGPASMLAALHAAQRFRR